MASPPSTPRRTQAERSAATRDALLDATIECLIEDGYANTTTSRVAERAGVSRGAHLHHFQTRSALVAAAVERLATRRTEQGLVAAQRLPGPGRERLEAGLDLMWAAFDHPLFQAAVDLWSHARTDEELRSHLVPVERVLDRQTLEIAANVFPDLAGRPDFEPLVEFATATMRGLALLDTLNPGSRRGRKQWASSCRDELVELFERHS